MEKLPRILIVEDDPFLGDLAHKKFKLEGFEVINAHDGEEVFTWLKKTPPDVVLLDIMLPGIDGYEILKRMKTSPQYKEIPVIMYSNLGQQDQIDKAMQMGAVDFCVKAHHTLEEIVEKVKKAIS